MPKHTPGPWAELTGTISGPDGDEIAEVVGGDGGRYLDDGVNAECAANARLIAAAPELLEALDNCITNENATCIVQNDVAYMIRRFKAINQICRAAIAKATAE